MCDTTATTLNFHRIWNVRTRNFSSFLPFTIKRKNYSDLLVARISQGTWTCFTWDMWRISISTRTAGLLILAAQAKPWPRLMPIVTRCTHLQHQLMLPNGVYTNVSHSIRKDSCMNLNRLHRDELCKIFELLEKLTSQESPA
jgi:hypothetical protein